ncbi:MAG: hypothetical protein WC052_05150 [Patescibacteria group bacterium]
MTSQHALDLQDRIKQLTEEINEFRITMGVQGGVPDNMTGAVMLAQREINFVSTRLQEAGLWCGELAKKLC